MTVLLPEKRERFFISVGRRQGMAWKTITSETLVSGRFCTVKKNEVELPDGTRIDDFYTVTISDSAMVCALTPEN